MRFRVTDAKGSVASGLQVIGWDPKQKQIRSWTFESNGTVIKSSWRQRDDQWISTAVATLPDGQTGTHTIITRPMGDQGFGWQKINTFVGDETLPNLDEVIVQPRGTVSELSVVEETSTEGPNNE